MKAELMENRTSEIIELHNGIIGKLKQSVSEAIRIGQLLTEQKASMKHGEFTPWVKAHLPFTDRTARSYMNLYRNQDRLKTETVSGLKSAYKLISSAAKPKVLTSQPEYPYLSFAGAKEYEAVRNGLIPPDGKRIVGIGYVGENLEMVWIEPSTNEGYHYVSFTQENIEWLEGGRKPMKLDHQTEETPDGAIFWLLERRMGLDYRNALWYIQDCPVLSENLLYNAEDKLLNQSLLWDDLSPLARKTRFTFCGQVQELVEKNDFSEAEALQAVSEGDDHFFYALESWWSRFNKTL